MSCSKTNWAIAVSGSSLFNTTLASLCVKPCELMAYRIPLVNLCRTYGGPFQLYWRIQWELGRRLCREPDHVCLTHVWNIAVCLLLTFFCTVLPYQQNEGQNQIKSISTSTISLVFQRFLLKLSIIVILPGARRAETIPTSFPCRQDAYSKLLLQSKHPLPAWSPRSSY